MSSKLRLAMQQYIFGELSIFPWHWELVEDSGDTPFFELMTDVIAGFAGNTGIYSFGAVLSPTARAIALLNPQLLSEMGEVGRSMAEAQERLQGIRFGLEKLHRSLPAGESAEDVAALLTKLKTVMSLLQ